MAAIQYNRVIRKLVVGFGNIFNNITLVRYNKDESEAERLLVPIVYATKEYYVRRLEEDYNLDKKVQVTLPRMSFEMTGLSYDNSRKQNTNIKNFAGTSNGVIAQYNPVPYNFDFNLYIYVRNTEDGTQIIEHILPYFTPDYTIKLNLIPEMGLVKEVPVVLNSVNSDITYEGASDSETRTIIWTLNFTVKGFIYGKSSTAGLIKSSITSVYDAITPNDIGIFNIVPNSGLGEYQVGEVVYQGYSINTSTATARVVSWSNNKLKLKEIDGNFISTLPIYGLNTNANYKYSSHDLQPVKIIKVDVDVDPPTANANSYSIVTTVEEYTSNTSGNIQSGTF